MKIYNSCKNGSSDESSLDINAIIPLMGFDQLHSYGYKISSYSGYENILKEFKKGKYVRLVVRYSCIIPDDSNTNIANIERT